ncbi:MAG: hypothetical protein U0T77_01775 [Chitinophagales bacterium]
MKTRTLFSLLLIASFMLTISCKKSNDITGGLGGQTDITLTQLGNESMVYIEGSPNPAIMTVIQNDDGTVIYKIAFDLTGRSDSALLTSLIPPKFLDNQNRINLNLHLKITSEGYQDADKPFIIVKYDSKVGDRYSYTTPEGQTLVRTVTQKSTEDDFLWNFMLIKTITVEQTTFNPDLANLVTKYTYVANHRFGMVYFQADLKTGGKIKMNIVPQFSL